MAYKRSIDAYEFYNRAKVGEKCTQDDWDLMTIPTKTAEIKKRYGLDFKGEFIPTNADMADKLFKAGFDMLLEAGVFVTDTQRVVKYTADEIWDAVRNPMPEFKLGLDRDAVMVKKRTVGDKKGPIIQGGPTGAPVSEDVFAALHTSYALEKEVDTIVNGVLYTIRGLPPAPSTPAEILAAKMEGRIIKQATATAGRPGMAI